MKYTFFTFTIFIFFNFANAQNFELSPEQIAAMKRFEEIKRAFLNADYDGVVNFYDSLMSKQKSTKLEMYKMANLSYLELSKATDQDSVSLVTKANKAFEEAVKWNGKMLVSERWDSLKIIVSDEPEIFHIVDQQPEFPGGIAEFYKYVVRELKYPKEARKRGIEGKVFIQFVVNKDGSIDAVNAVKNIGGGCDEEAVRVIKNAPDFYPGMQDGKPVYVKMILPINFKLSGNSPKKKNEV